LVDRLTAEVGAQPATINFALTNGNKLYALHRGGSMTMVRRTQLPASAQTSSSETNRAASAVRYALITTDAVSPAAGGYDAIQQDTLIVIDRDIEIARYSVL
jgi:hypothetical protein